MPRRSAPHRDPHNPPLTSPRRTVSRPRGAGDRPRCRPPHRASGPALAARSLPMRLRASLSRVVSLVLFAVLLGVVPTLAADKPPAGKPAGGPPPADDKDKPYQDWKKVTKDAEVKKGFFNLYSKRENLYMEIAPAQLDK